MKPVQNTSKVYIASMPYGRSTTQLDRIEATPGAHVWLSKSRGYRVQEPYNAIKSRFQSQDSRVYSVFTLPHKTGELVQFSSEGEGFTLRVVPNRFQTGLSIYALGTANSFVLPDAEVDVLDSTAMMGFSRPTALESMCNDFSARSASRDIELSELLSEDKDLEDMLVTLSADGRTLIRPHVQMIELETADSKDVLAHHEIWETRYQ